MSSATNASRGIVAVPSRSSCARWASAPKVSTIAKSLMSSATGPRVLGRPRRRSIRSATGRGVAARRARPQLALGLDREEGAAARVVELARERFDHDAQERFEAELAGGLDRVEELLAPPVELGAVLLDDGGEEFLATAEPVVHRAGVLQTGRHGDLRERHRVDTARGEQLLGRLDEPLAGPVAVGLGRHRPAV